MWSKKLAMDDETDTSDGTAAVAKKRCRRVSFAEITSVHVFDRDEDCQTPNDDENDDDNNNNNNNNNNIDDEFERFNRDLDFLKGDKIEEEAGLFFRPNQTPTNLASPTSNDEDDNIALFFRPNESPSSATSNDDEDNFFGPVSSSFIRPGRLSDSGASDAHDITMDSTAFSQHFRSLARSDSGGEELKTPTGVPLSFEESTPSQNHMPDNTVGSSMLLNATKKPIIAYSTSPDKSSGGSDSNDMSIVEANPNKYDYGRLSFGLETLLAEGVKDVHNDDNATVSNKDIISHSPIHPALTPADELNQSSDILTKGVLSTKVSGASDLSLDVDSHVVNSGTKANQKSEIPQTTILAQQQNESPLARSLSLSKQRQTVFKEAALPNTLHLSTPQNQVMSMTDEIGRRAGTVPSIQKSISRLRILNASPFTSNLNVNMTSLLNSSDPLFRTPPYNTSLSRIQEDYQIKHVNPSTAWGDQSQIVAKGSREINTTSNIMLNSGAISENLIDGSSRGPGVAKFENSPARRSAEVVASEQSSGLAQIRSLVSQLASSGEKTKMDLLTSEDPTEDPPWTSSRKRMRKDVISAEIECVDEISRLQKSPKVQKGLEHESEVLSGHYNERNTEANIGVHKSVEHDFEVLSGHHNGSNTETSTGGHGPRLRHWSDVLSEVLARNMLPPSTDELNLREIDELEDKMVKLQRFHAYEMSHNILQSQKSAEDLASVQHKKTGEAKILLQRLMHERARLQLMRVKRERLQNNVQLIRQASHEVQQLKAKFFPHIRPGCSRDANINSSPCRPINISERREKVPDVKVTELTQLRDSLQSKITLLTKSFHSSCKLEGILSHEDTVSAVDGYLKKKECSKQLRSDLQLWKVQKIFNKDGDRNLVLNYLDLVIQRISFKAGSASSLRISIELNDSTKSFFNMDALTAFSFVLNATATRNYVGPPSLKRETQITSSVLGNLVDVAQEVQQARFKLINLTHARFVSPSVGQLELHFHFVGIRSGRKVALTVDISCLKWGIYPSNLMPYKLESSSELSWEALPEQPSAEIRAAIQGLGVGFWRILRMCRTVSQVVEAWSG